MPEVIACTSCCAPVANASIKVCYPEPQREAVDVDDDIRRFVRMATGGTFDPFDPMIMR